MNFLIITLSILLNFTSLDSLKWSVDRQSAGSERYQSALRLNDDSQSIRSVNYSEIIRNNRDTTVLTSEIDSKGLIGKIDVLSKLLRVHIDDFRDKTDRVEIVFLVDASSSVGQENFKSELNFVRRLLSDLTVDEAATRVAVVTFAGKGMIIRKIDQISLGQINQRNHENKCTLLNDDLKNISWSGGGTYTRGALLEALTILRSSRSDAAKVVFLVTDGFSNGGDPRPVAKMLKDLGAIILTFGIRTGNVQELHDVASEPGYTHSYLLDSFVEFEAMARRALHRDVKPGQYVPTLTQSSCTVLCEQSQSTTINDTCCDALASCYCGTTSGHYACLCPVGYFGSGLQSSCHPCPNGTYGAATSQSSDSSSNCLACPSPNHITLRIPATSPSDCVCASGFNTINTTCEAITCPKLRVPENGYLVKASACSNVVNAACGHRCRIGFRLVGDSIRLCNKTGIWSGTETQCLLKTCPALRAPVHGDVHCEHDEEYQNLNTVKLLDPLALPIDAQCQFKCDLGYQLLGSKLRNCLPVSRWDGLKVSCKQIKCEPLPKVANGIINPDVCTGTKKLMFGTNCSISCLPGYDLQGPASRKCIGSSGLWSQRHTSSRCIDKTPPEITCPADETWETLLGKRFALVNLTLPLAKDNSDKLPHVWSKPHLTFPWKAKIGSHEITYVAQDLSGNRARCRFVVTVIDKEPPMVENCVDPPIFLVSNHKGADNVTWDEPIFHDNSGKKLIVKASHHQGASFPLGTTEITYNVSDRSENIARCIIKITVENACKDLPMVNNGAAQCRNSEKQDESVRCVITCNEGYVLPMEQDGTNDNIVLSCNSLDNGWNETFLTDCAVSELPQSVEFGGSIIFESNKTICNEAAMLEHLKMEIRQDLAKNFGDNCNDNGIDCRLANIDLICQENNILTFNRKRRSEGNNMKQKIRVKRKRDRIDMRFRFIARILTEYHYDPTQALQKLREEIHTMTKSGKLNLLNEKTNREIANLALNLRTIFEENVKSFCEMGKILRKDKCVRCPAGTFHNSEIVRNNCVACPLGEYQDIPGSGNCKSCPDGTSTRRTHTTSVHDCVRICRPGFYSKKRYHRDQIMALEPCLSCDLGTYQPFYGQNHCSPCPGNGTTSERGSTDISTCVIIQEICSNDSCLNSGRCIPEPGGFSCDCTDHFFGSRCEQLRNPCQSSPCLNEGACTFTRNPFNYFCLCRNNFRGRHCEDYLDECLANPCTNGGTCVSSENDFKCSCREGYDGEFCEIKLDLCSNVCEEGSSCVISQGTWKCLCKPGFLGRRCQLVPCDWMPCYPNAICINLEEFNTTHASYKCVCPIGYKGEDCLTRINHCHDLPCQNGGVCINNLSNYTCLCPMAYEGLNCEWKLSSDFVLHYLKPGTTDYVLLKAPWWNLTELTICLWLQSTDTFNYGTVFSYANKKHDNAITLTDYNGLVLYINGLKIVTDITLNDGFWHFLCVTWRSHDGSWSLFVDGVLRDSSSGLAKGTAILGNGSIVIGQEQDDIQGQFSSSEAFVGRLTLLDVWNSTLTADLIKNLTETCEEYAGNLITWAALKKHVFGNIKIENTNFCHGCETLVAPIKGYLNISDDLSTTTYFCESGYNLKIGNRVRRYLKRKCLKHGQWEGHYDHIKCSKVICGYPGYFPRGKVHGNSFSFGDEIYYTCDDGYELRGNSHRVCNFAGSWSGRPPICIGVTCKSLLAPEHGDIEYIIEEHERDDLTILQVGQQLEFKCNPGFELIGQRILTCTKSGSWNFEIPVCRLVRCSLPVLTAHTHIEHNDNDSSSVLFNKSLNYFYEYGDILRYSCDEGFIFESNDTLNTLGELQCSINGSWTAANATCTALACPAPIIEHSNFVKLKEAFNFGEQLRIVCEEGYTGLVDDVQCDSTGQWSPEVPKCLPIHCPPLSRHPIANLFVARPAIKARSAAYAQTDVSDALEHLTLAIEGDGLDDKLILRCSEEQRELKLHNTRLNITLKQISWRCNEKGLWEVQDNLNLEDNDLRSLLMDKEVCDGGCSPPLVPLNAFVVDIKDSDNWQYNKKLTFKCRSGFIIKGSETVFCRENGLWTNYPTCRPINCGNPPIIADGTINMSNFSDSSYDFGRIVQYLCLDGYRMFGLGSIRCLASGKWSRLQGKCSRISCGKPDIIDGVKLVGKSYLYGENLTFICPGNITQDILTCKADGSWSNLPIC